MFIGREKEQQIIKELLNKTSGSIMIYGKRKIGKTTLITHTLKNHKDITIYYECIKSTLQENIDSFISILVKANVMPIGISFTNFIDLFRYLNSLSMNLNIVIDEYPYLKEFTNSKIVDSIFQNIIDNHLSNIRLFISGSHISMMKDLLEESNALFGRFTSVICLKELDYKTSADFYSNKTPYDKAAFYSIFGGSPFINQFINPNESLKTNVINTILNPLSAVYHYANNLLLSDFSINSNMERIFSSIANGKKKYTDIQNKLKLNDNGLLSKQMKILLNMDLIIKVSPINKLNDNKKSRYEINDNLLRFFYTYINSNKSALQILGAEVFYEEYIQPSINTFISHRFESICRDFFSNKVKKKEITGVLNIGTYYYDDPITKTNGEFDVVLQRKNVYDIFEVKYQSGSLSYKEMLNEINQVKEINNIKIGNIGFISINGFENSNEFICITGEDLYQ